MEGKYVFPIRVRKGGRCFEDQTGTPFFWNADTCWRIFWMLSYEEACDYLEIRARQGFTVVQVHLLPHRIYQTNVYGELPFSAPGKIDQLNEAYFQHVDRVLRYGRELGLCFAVAPMWLSTWEDDWHTLYRMPEVGRYISSVAQRYRNTDNIIAFIHGGDDDAEGLRSEIIRCAERVRELAPDILQTFHAGIGPGYPLYGDQDWYDFSLNYTYDRGDCVRQMLGAAKCCPEKPAVLGETHYEGNRDITAKTIRGFAYASVILGGAGQTYGHKDVWMATMFWRESLFSAGAHHIGVLREIMESIPWEQLQPDAEGKLLETRRSKMPYAASDLIPAAATRDERLLIAYVGDTRWFSVQGKGRYHGKWIDPVSGKHFPTEGSCGDILSVPGQNAGGDTDWLLLLSFAGDALQKERKE
ncbi:apiosidase-like domain-containing protein [Lachnoclostridium sp. Marseille-P6806]|uniref:apiosidase-like domain-containing protein n=1 Tax=Lachnoclostridium sp. Marseille-P6806 TaxID=2364793 RepID=UPI00103015AA|nr:DUF4038 domain-containing protein [Lachnoclostridium sp. Marseille-P6806]